MRFLMIVSGRDMLPVPAGTDFDPTAWVDETTASGQRVTGDGVQGGDAVRVVRVRGGQTEVTTGPMMGDHDYVGGFDVLECADMAEAVEVAARHPMAAYGTLEIRPFMIWD